MSLFRQQSTIINDAACLVDTLEKQGYKNVESHETPQKLLGSPIKGGDDSAEVIVRKSSNPTLYGDLGFKKQADGSYAMCTRMFVESKNGKFLTPERWTSSFIKEYGVNKAKKIAKKNGWALVKTKSTEGKTILQFQVA